MCQRLRRWTQGMTVQGVRRPDNGNVRLGRYQAADIFVSCHIVNVHRLGKTIEFDLLDPDGSARKAYCHNAMSGYWDTAEEPWTFDYVEGKRVASDSDVRVYFDMYDAAGRRAVLRFHDSRKFGRISAAAPVIGPELLVTTCSAPDVQHAITHGGLIERGRKGKDRTIKSVLMDQKVVAGVGNIYASETLFLSGIDPRTLMSRLSDGQLAAIQGNAAIVMASALSRRLDYSTLRIYRRKECPWGHPVENARIDKRSSYFCPKCQV